MSRTAVVRNMMTHVVPGNSWYSNYKLTLQASLLLFSSSLITLLCVLLLQAGDIQPNQGPSTNHSSLHDHSTSSSFLNLDFSNLAKHLSFMHYNVQSLAPKLDNLAAELIDFDILAFSETWLSENPLTDDLLIESFSRPEWKDRIGDRL